MNSDLKRAIEAKLSAVKSLPVHLVQHRPVGGGCINEAFAVSFNDGSQYFVKTNQSECASFFEAEADGLKRLGAADLFRVPQVLAWGEAGGAGFLVLELIEPGPRPKGFFESMGHLLARLHQTQTKSEFGLPIDNYLGSSPQPNAMSSDWAAFWGENRLGFQLRLASERQLATKELLSLGEGLIRRLQGCFAGTEESPALIHGDLWSGNYFPSASGLPVLVDPAVYFGHREAEFGMTTLFGGFDDSFYEAYNEVWPLADGYRERIEIYRLYHLLNHLNLFGSSYLADCLTILRKYQ